MSVDTAPSAPGPTRADVLPSLGVPRVESGFIDGTSGGNRGPDVATTIQGIASPHDAIKAVAHIQVDQPPRDLPVINPETGRLEPTYSPDEYTDPNPKIQAEIKAAQTAANGGSTEAGINRPGTITPEVAPAGATTPKVDTVANPPEALSQEQKARQAELTEAQTAGKATAAQQAELIKLDKQQEAFDGLQQQQMARGKEVSDALNSGIHTDASGNDFTQSELDLADRYRAEQQGASTNAEGVISKPASYAEKAGELANKRSAFDKVIAKGTYAPDKSEAGIRPTDPILGVEQGRTLNPGEQDAYDKHMQGIEGKIKNDQPLTRQEASDYKAHLERQEKQMDSEAHAEAVDLGAQINRELADPKNAAGEMSEATKGRFVAFVDSLTGGAYSKNALFAEALGLDLLDAKGKAQIAGKLQKLSEKMTPEIAKRINERLQLLAQLEVQVYSLRAQRDENALAARDVKKFIKDNYANYNPQDDPDSLTDQAAMEKRQKWIQALSTLNAYKAAIGAAEKAHVVLLQEAGQVRADLYKELGVNKGEGFRGWAVRKLGNWAQRNETDALITLRYDEIEDKVDVSAAAQAKHKSPDLSGLKP